MYARGLHTVITLILIITLYELPNKVKIEGFKVLGIIMSRKQEILQLLLYSNRSRLSIYRDIV